MAASETLPVRYLLRLAEGRSATPDLLLRLHTPRPVFGAGTHGVWRIKAEEVLELHVLFAFNGRDLYVAAAPGATATLDGEPLPERWVPVRSCAQIELGHARIAILPRPVRRVPAAAPAAAPAPAPTRVDRPPAAPPSTAEDTAVTDDETTLPFARLAASEDATTIAAPELVRALCVAAGAPPSQDGSPLGSAPGMGYG